MSKNPLVSICCITYNHGKYVQECLDGFFKQKVNFEYEILLHDDASTDDTVSIIKKYEEKYPNVIRPIYQTENQRSKGVRMMNSTFNFPRARGKYLAICEGDDYWKEPFKLQRQVDFLEENENYSCVFHQTEVISELGNSLLVHEDIRRDLELKDIIRTTIPFHLNSMLFRKDELVIPSSLRDFRYGDRVLISVLGLKGKFKYIDIIGSIYRKHEGGVTAKSDFPIKKNKELILLWKRLRKIAKEKNLYQNASSAFSSALLEHRKKVWKYYIYKLVGPIYSPIKKYIKGN